MAEWHGVGDRGVHHDEHQAERDGLADAAHRGDCPPCGRWGGLGGAEVGGGGLVTGTPEDRLAVVVLVPQAGPGR